MAINMGRWTVENDDDVVVFLIGTRINKLIAVRQWLPVVRAMGPMLRQLSTERDRGLLGFRALPTWRGVTLIQYWKSHADLQRYAHDGLHRSAWMDFFRKSYRGGAVGIWHETYAVPAGSYEAIYGNTPPLGLAAATSAVPVGKGRERAEDRMAVRTRA